MIIWTARKWAWVRSTGLVVAPMFSPAAAAPIIEVDSPVVVAVEETGNATWTDVVAHPVQRDRLMISGAVVRGPRSSPASYGYVDLSSDGGRSWRRTLRDDSANWCSEQAAAFGLEGRAYFVSAHEHNKQGLWLWRSDDGGATWREVLRRGPFVDLTAMRVDASKASPWRDRLYIFGHHHRDPSNPGHRRIAMPLLRSEDGESVSAPLFPVEGSRKRGRSTAFPGGAVVLEDGTVLAVYQTLFAPEGQEDVPPSSRPQAVEVVRSVDGGRSSIIACVALFRFWSGEGALPDIPAIAAGLRPGSSKQTVYVVWSDLEDGPSSIRLSRSLDGGASWSKAVRVDDLVDDGSKGRFAASHPNVAVDREGRVAVCWRDMRRAGWRASASLDGGHSFGPSRPLSPEHEPADEHARRGLYSIERASDVGLAADAGGRFHFAWSEREGGGSRMLAVRFVVTGKE